MNKLTKFLYKKISEQVNAAAQAETREVEDGLGSSESFVRLCRQMAAEGMVLLKNDGVFPIEDEQTAVFGRCQINSFYVGYGSGGDIRPPYRVSIAEGLIQNGFPMDQQLYEIYRSWCEQNAPVDGFWGHWPMYYDEMPLEEALVSAAAGRCEKALVVIGRAAGEDRENKPEKGSWYLTDIERANLELVRKHVRKVGVLLNCGSIMDVSFLEELGIDGALYLWQGGQEMGNAVYDVVSGKTNPCGRLTDTQARIEDYPSNPNFGHWKYNTYAEDIYVGYRYFETFAKGKVIFPFGYGLSYTVFETQMDAVSDQELRVTVTNTGKRAGKEVVQLYASAPQGKLGKSARELMGFVKTRELRPGESQSFTLRLDWEAIAAFDDSGVTGHRNAWILETGTYDFYLGRDVRQAERVHSVTLTEARVIAQCREAAAPTKAFKRLVNRYGAAVYEPAPLRQKDLKTRILDTLPQEIPCTGDRGYRLSDVKSGKIALDDFVAQLSAEEMEALARGSLEGMNASLGPKGNAGVFGGTEPSLRDKGIPVISTNDGPSGVRLQAHTTLMPNGVCIASSWNAELTEQLCGELGKEVLDRGSLTLLAPALNIHRHPLCGRNFEYFSEDPLLSGMTAAAYVKGVQKAGAYATVKHFACNNQEVNRRFNDSRLSQRALREIYLKGFQICIREASPACLMTAYNKVNGEWAFNHYDLAMEILRKEWHYDGLVMTDWGTPSNKSRMFPGLRNHAIRIRAHVNVFMPGSNNLRMSNGKVDGSVADGLAVANGLRLAELQANAKRVLDFCLKHT